MCMVHNITKCVENDLVNKDGLPSLYTIGMYTEEKMRFAFLVKMGVYGCYKLILGTYKLLQMSNNPLILQRLAICM